MPEERGHALAEVAAEHVAVEGVHHYLRPGGAGEPRCDSPDRSGLRGVRVQDLRPLPADQADELPDGDGVLQRRDLPLERPDEDGFYAQLVGERLHRALVLADPSGDVVVW